MKIIDNAKKHGLPPREALYDAPADTLYLYASFKGLCIGMRAAFRRGRFDSQIATFSLYGAEWSAYPSTQKRFHGFIDTIIHVLSWYGIPADDTQADDTQADDTQADDTQADDTQADDTQAVAVTRSYRRKVSCAGDPDLASWCVVFRAGGQSYVRAYQSRGRAAYAFHCYHMGGASSVFLLYRSYFSPGWSLATCVIDDDSCDALPYTDTHLLVENAISLASRHFGGGV